MTRGPRQYRNSWEVLEQDTRTRRYTCNGGPFDGEVHVSLPGGTVWCRVQAPDVIRAFLATPDANVAKASRLPDPAVLGHYATDDVMGVLVWHPQHPATS
jgi:hypothetical protein